MPFSPPAVLGRLRLSHKARAGLRLIPQVSLGSAIAVVRIVSHHKDQGSASTKATLARAASAGRPFIDKVKILTLDDINNLVGSWTQNNVTTANEDKIVSTPFWINLYDAVRQRIETNRAWNSCSD